MREKNRQLLGWSLFTMFIAKSFRNKQSPCTVSCSECFSFCCFPFVLLMPTLFAHDLFASVAEACQGVLIRPRKYDPKHLDVKS